MHSNIILVIVINITFSIINYFIFILIATTNVTVIFFIVNIFIILFILPIIIIFLIIDVIEISSVANNSCNFNNYNIC